MHVATIKSRQVRKSGDEREYVSHLLRHTYREGGKVRHQTLANLSALPEEAVAAVRAVLAGRPLLEAETELEVARSLRHGTRPRSGPKRTPWGCRACSGRRAGPATWPWR